MEHLVCEDQQDPLAPRESKGLLDQLDRLELQVLMVTLDPLVKMEVRGPQAFLA